jgi:pyruvate/2-oxoglutarate dehydrogenase complex dihydrolipoamide dehydrogenase (E3) component
LARPRAEHYDLVVIGSGPGGEGAAMTAVIERHTEVGE